MAVTKEPPHSEQTDEMIELKKSLELSSESEDEAEMNPGNGNLVDSPYTSLE